MATGDVTGRFKLDFPLEDRLSVLESKLDKLILLHSAKTETPATKDPIAQIDAILMLRTTFPTFKKLVAEFQIRPIKRGSRLFYRSSDIQKILNGQKK